MLKLKLVCAAALVSAVGLSVVSTGLSAGIFDRLKRRAAPKAAPLRRAQSPQYDPADYGSNRYVAPAHFQQGDYGTDAPWYSSGYSSADDECCQCGPVDKCGWKTKLCRMKCDQTYYCPVPPYCYACFGNYPTCWTRMQECQVCPRTEYSWHPTHRKTAPARVPAAGSGVPAAQPPADPLAPPVAEPPPDLPDEARLRRPARALPERVGMQAVRQPAPWSDYADSIVDEVETAEEPAGTLEDQIAADDAATEESTLEDAETPLVFEEPGVVEEVELAPPE